MSRDALDLPTLRAIRDAAKRAADRCDTESGNPSQDYAASIKWSVLEMFADQLDEAITTAERDNGS